MRTCSSCNEIKADFAKGNQCRDCYNEYMRIWHQKNKDRVNKERNDQLRSRLANDPEFKAKEYTRMKTWRNENKEKVNEQGRVRKQKRKAGPALHRMDLETKRMYREDPEHKAKDLSYAKIKHKERQAFINEIKSVPCMDCGNMFPPCAMDFDHVNGEKVANISEMKTYTIERIKEEISKCDIVCSNCHRIRTFKRKGSDESLTTLKPILITPGAISLQPNLNVTPALERGSGCSNTMQFATRKTALKSFNPQQSR